MKKTFLILLIVLLAVPIFFSYAQPPAPITHPEQVIQALNRLLNYVWTILGILVVILLLYAGFNFVTAGGDETKLGKAKDSVKWSLVGIAVMILSGGVMLLIENFLRGA